MKNILLFWRFSENQKPIFFNFACKIREKMSGATKSNIGGSGEGFNEDPRGKPELAKIRSELTALKTKIEVRMLFLFRGFFEKFDFLKMYILFKVEKIWGLKCFFYFFQKLTEEEKGLRFTNAALRAKSALFEDDRKAMVSNHKVRWVFSCFLEFWIFCWKI